ncbi:MAG: 4-hydroxy-3-methylbut-2-enyl diphosphate reductase [Lacrimispora saccharolytica]|nr:4-hydroxy-3-methylbut-2-enyl diphosphate reductase [Lachnospiraceae bacterium]
MEVTVAKSAGFCFGVKRAVDTVYEQIEKGQKPVYTYGPIIHNEQVVEDLAARGVQVIRSEEELERITEGTVIIRSHGVPRRICDKIKAQGLTLVDATCPFVRKIHRIVEQESEKGNHIVIIGSEPHPEVEGIKGWASGPVTVISTEEEARSFVPENGKNVSIVAQTTFNYNKFKDLVEIFSKKSYDISVLNTICNATEERQTEARTLAGTVDTMLVIGGRHSSNTQKLYEICKEECKNTYFIETLVDLDTKPFQSFGRVGITAGASTPNKIIEEVQKHVRIKF